MGNDVCCMTRDKKYKVKKKLYELEERLEIKVLIKIFQIYINRL